MAMSDHEPQQKETGLFGRGFKGLKQASLKAIQWKLIKDNAQFIHELGALLRRKKDHQSGLVIGEDRMLDVAATADLYQVPVEFIEDLIMKRRRQTKQAAYCAFGFGWLAFLYWLYQSLTRSWSSGHVIETLEFAPFCLVFFLIAFRNALLNYQLRTGHVATAMEYLRTEKVFWPA
ncbi:hypothetical protein [Beijerinckia indica]|uniref:Uncharacterized protein n=1 Tax=Beijerinckia indica subsp. indica (strain ATCC 9039 / DSM 1715 / NCIMB 8712) TaxID=395963 RepID=B2ILI0_BEII9|nr:hypothetical protein [Beijerinckia indica]ACB97380.1 hypothetical protein Bind_3851 [Beijerinckia indica subsp. indica ATCC 9039]